MKNRKLLLIVSLVLALTMSLGGTLAYLTDTDEAVNVMTLGNVDIEQYEKDAEGNTFEQNQPLYPAYYTTDKEGNITSAVTGAIDKVVSVKNVGDSEAYVRTLLAFEAGNLNYADFQKYIHTEFEMEAEWLQTPINVKGVNYYVACVDYDKLAAGIEGDASLLKVFMDKAATNEIVAQFGNTYEIVALSQAVQTKNMPNAELAWEDSFGAFNVENAAKWFDGVSVIPVTTVSTAAELTAAFAKGGTVVLAADLDLVATSENVMIATVPQGVSVTLDLNGHNINANTEAVESNVASGVFSVEKGASLTINGDGNVYMDANDDAMNAMNAIILNSAGKVTINGGNYGVELGTKGGWDAVTGAYGALIPCIIDNNSGAGDAVLTINGGTFTFDRNMIRNFCQSMQATININGGTFIGTDENGSNIWNQKPSANSKPGVININGGTFSNVHVIDEFNEDAVQPEQTAVKTVSTAEDLVNAFANIKTGDHIILMADIDMTGKTLDATNGNKGFTLQGNDHTISNLNGTEQGLFVNNTGSADYYFYNVNLKNCHVESAKNYAGLFVGDADTCDELVIEGCTVTDCTVKSAKYAAAFVAYTAGYNVQNNGPVYSDVTIKDCKMIGGSITGGGSTAVAVGHAGGNVDTTTTITNLQVNNVAINGEDAEHTGIVVGTAGVGKTIISNVAYFGVTGNYNTATNLYGRFVPGTTGALTIDGVEKN